MVGIVRERERERVQELVYA